MRLLHFASARLLTARLKLGNVGMIILCLYLFSIIDCSIVRCANETYCRLSPHAIYI